MKTVSRPRRSLLAGLVLALGISGIPGISARAAGPDAAARIGTEIDRLEKALSDKPAADPDWRGARPEIAGTLARARASLRAGRLYWSLQELEQARTSLRATEATKEPVTRGGMPAFEAAWKKTDAELTALDGEARARSRATTSAAFRSQAESAAGQTLILLQASHSQGRVTSPGEGFYYLGQARAAAESARFCASLPAPRAAAPFPLRSLAPEIRALENRVVALFKPPYSIQHHGDFIVLNGTLKLAAELDAAQLYGGALQQYLDALLQLDRLDRAVPDAREQARLRGKVAAEHARLRAAPEDNSIAELFVERAEAHLGPNADDWKTVAVIVDRVLPAYAAARKPAPHPSQVASRLLTVTLVRWPYT